MQLFELDLMMESVSFMEFYGNAVSSELYCSSQDILVMIFPGLYCGIVTITDAMMSKVLKFINYIIMRPHPSHR